MITFINTKLAKVWKQKTGTIIEYAGLYNTRETYELVPKEVVVLTVGIDVQADDRIEYTVIGYTEDSQRYFFEHIKINGDTSLPHTQKGSPYLELEKHMRKTYKNRKDNYAI